MEGEDVMATEYHDDFSHTESRDDTAFWNRATGPRLGMGLSTVPPRWKVLVLPSLCAVLLLALIISVSVSNMKTDRRVSSVEKTVVNLSSFGQTLLSSLQQSHASVDEAHEEIGMLRVSMEISKVHLESESVKVVDEVVTLRQKVDSLKCSLDRLLKNDSTLACCPLDWVLFSSRCFLFSDSGLSWNAARDYCVQHHSQLAVLKTREEWRFVGQKASPTFYWIGLTDERTGRWEWVDGSTYTMDRSHWLPNQPDNWETPELTGTEDCAHLHTNGRLNDLHCVHSLRFICQGPVFTPHP